MKVKDAKDHYKTSEHLILEGEMWPAHDVAKKLANKPMKEEIERICKQEIDRVAKVERDRANREAASKQRAEDEARAAAQAEESDGDGEDEDGEDGEDEQEETVRGPKRLCVRPTIKDDSDDEGEDGHMTSTVYGLCEDIDLTDEAKALAEFIN